MNLAERSAEPFKTLDVKAVLKTPATELKIAGQRIYTEQLSLRRSDPTIS
ncbi:hypothetical protein QMK50_08510 [Pseudomonas sp. P5_152]|nr:MULTISPECIES: hypothetical protein [unclassified Pseudomonas]MDX9665012.1 hypothetical protein [Pseudomonas sp. P5_152]